jgi:hypothetical protein
VAVPARLCQQQGACRLMLAAAGLVLSLSPGWAAASAVSATTPSSAIDLTNVSGHAVTVHVVATAVSDDLATAMAAELAPNRHLIDFSFWEFGGSHGVEIVGGSGSLACTPCITPGVQQSVNIDRVLLPGHHLLIGGAGVRMTAAANHALRASHGARYASTQGDTRGIATAAGESADATAAEAGTFNTAMLPDLPGPTIVLASIPCDAAGTGSATLSDGRSGAALNCQNNYLAQTFTPRSSRWALHGAVTGITGLRTRLAALVLL